MKKSVLARKRADTRMPIRDLIPLIRVKYPTGRPRGKSGNRYLTVETPDGVVHFFVEVEAKGAAMDCGSGLGRDEANTRTHIRRVMG